MRKLGSYTTPTGQKLNLRRVEKEDTGLLVDLFYHLSTESKRLRFHLYATRLPEERVWEEAELLSNLDPQRQVAVAATVVEDDGEEHAVGVARLARATPADTEAEVAVVVRDDFQRRGVGKKLLECLADQARTLGITHFSAWIMSENVRLMKLIRGLELQDVESETRLGETKIRAPI